jgi:hypothetical protein
LHVFIAFSSHNLAMRKIFLSVMSALFITLLLGVVLFPGCNGIIESFSHKPVSLQLGACFARISTKPRAWSKKRAHNLPRFVFATTGEQYPQRHNGEYHYYNKSYHLRLILFGFFDKTTFVRKNVVDGQRHKTHQKYPVKYATSMQIVRI